jgi:hypothetical protein
MLTPEESFHPVYANLIDVHFQMEMEDGAYAERVRRRRDRQASHGPKRSPEAIENNRSSENKNTANLASHSK